MSKSTKKPRVLSCPKCGSENLNGVSVEVGRAYRCNSCGKEFTYKPSFNTTGLETEKKISFGVAGINETTGMCNITIPNDMLDGELNVTIDGGQPLYSAAPLNNGAHTSLYFTYNNTLPHVVEITGTTVIPEFPITTALPMLITTLLATLVQLERKHKK